MSLGNLKPVTPAGERAPLWLVRDGAPLGSEAPVTPASGESTEDAAHRAATEVLGRWKRLCDRLESVSTEGELGDALRCFLRIGAEPLGACGGIIEGAFGAAGGEMLRVSFGLDERSSRALSSTTVAGGVLPIPDETEFVADLAQSEAYGGLLVRPFLETEGVLGVLSTPLRAKSGFAGVMRYCFSRQPSASHTVLLLAEMLAQRVVALIELRMLQRRSQAAESRLHSVLDGAGAAIITVSVEGRILESNDATTAIFGYQRDELRGMSLASLFPADSGRLLDGRRASPRAEPRALDFEAQRRDGSPFVAEVVVGAGALQSGRTLVVRDATARRSADAQMRQCERLAAIGTLAAGLSHDLNNTLLPLRAHLSALLPKRAVHGGAAKVHHVHEVRAGLAHLQELADAVHFLATDTDTCPTATSDIAGWWAHAGPLLEKALHGLASLEVSIAADLPRVRIEERALSRVVLSLLVNAGEAMPRERPRELARVLLRARCLDGGASAVIEVADNGMGMSDEVRRRAFDPYFTTKTRAIGSGLGLPIVRSIVEQTGGSVEIDTMAGVGTTVRLVLRAERPGAQRVGAPRVACTVSDGRIASMVRSVLATNGVVELEHDPSESDIWIVSDSELTDGVAERWGSARPASGLIVLGSRDGSRSAASRCREASVNIDTRDLSSLSAAIRQALVDAGTLDFERGVSNG